MPVANAGQDTAGSQAFLILQGQTALKYAVVSGKYDFVKLLLENGARVNTVMDRIDGHGEPEGKAVGVHSGIICLKIARNGMTVASCACCQR